MTLGGLALAVRHSGRRSHGADREHQLSPRTGQGGRDGHPGRGRTNRRHRPSSRMLCICIVFAPMFLLTQAWCDSSSCRWPKQRDVGNGLLVHPIAHAGANDGQLPACGLTRRTRTNHGPGGPLPPSRNPSRPPTTRALNAGFERICVSAYRELLVEWRCVIAAFSLSLSLCLVVRDRSRWRPISGATFFPRSMPAKILDARQRTRVGTRIEDTANPIWRHRKGDPPNHSRRPDLTTLVGNIGFPVSGISMTYNSGTIGSQDGDIQIKLSEDHRPTAEYVRMLREELPAAFPGERLFLSCQPISSVKFSISARRHRSICKFADPRSKRRLCLCGDVVTADSPCFRAWQTRAFSNRSTGPLSRSMSTGRAPNMSASPSATSPTAWSSKWPAAARWRPLTGSIPITAFPTPSSRRRRSTSWIR